MLIIAFTLGFFGSLHCLGMCGPLAIAFCQGQTQKEVVTKSLHYNIGRITSYAFIGLLFGLIGSLFVFTNLQKLLSVLIGIIMILSFFFSINLEERIRRLPLVKSFYNSVHKKISKAVSKSSQYPRLYLGLMNGFLPCGLVYLALAGSMATGNLIDGMTFMILFGLGTIPMMSTITIAVKLLSLRNRSKFLKTIPYVTLLFGVFMIYRGVSVQIPQELNFWEMLNNPIMCH